MQVAQNKQLAEILLPMADLQNSYHQPRRGSSRLSMPMSVIKGAWEHSQGNYTNVVLNNLLKIG